MPSAPSSSPFAIPDWVTGHPELKARGIELEITLKPVRIVLDSQAADFDEFHSVLAYSMAKSIRTPRSPSLCCQDRQGN